MNYNIVVLISGNGSVLQALIDAFASSAVKIVAVISNRADAYGLHRAELAHLPTHVISHNDYTERAAYEAALSNVIDQYQPQLIVLAGFMLILTPAFVHKYQGRLINIHPSLLPDYRGTNTHARVLAANEALHGTSVHLVTEELDGGPLIAQAYFSTEGHESAEQLHQQVQTLERQLYPLVIQWLAAHQLRCLAGKVEWLDPNLTSKTTNNVIHLSTEELSNLL